MDPNVGLHVIQGHSAAACLQTGLSLAPDRILIHHDVLSNGPLPAVDSLDGWLDVRESYLRSLDREWPFRFADADRDLLVNRGRLQSADTITIWIGTGLADQLMFIWLIDLLRRADVDTGRCHIVQFDVAGRYEVVGVGVLNPAEFARHPAPSRLTRQALEEATAAWASVTAPEPGALMAYLADQSHCLPFLPRALSALLHHYPDLDTGLNAWETQLLRYAGEVGPRAVRVVGYTMAHDMDHPDWPSDTYLVHRIHRLARADLRMPLLALTGDTTQLRTTEVRLTPAGETILAGQGNAVDWNGIDDWVGGVHLDSDAGRIWFHRKGDLIPR